ncbi:hypothetical protein OLN68_11195 [Citrobacter freundii]|jgi:hypothetical protein|uniref:hypothetical protein n=1 Tax=Citrobacter TaxID=544 RepID=UPI0010C99BE8|nr:MULTISPECIES: hypothetical protein [Citrobacter]MCW1434887.1 hypothetical protein [Citrobacter freundii]MBJ9030094.1 hypothetical protein [Citrobacter braakii]MCD9261511.1 hypothetical protein [Citrobacter braakii]MCW1446218.1 hypothetical protein [Citrobacter freundii]MDX7347063.1 hypothetical protein [Citrobacter braakii]
MIEKCFILTLVIMLSGCVSERNRTLSPPEDTQWVTVGVNVPEDLVVLPLEVGYRSERCKHTRHNSSGKAWEVPGYNTVEVPLTKKNAATDFFEAKIATNGGGQCKWHLSVINIKLAYKNTQKFGQQLTPVISVRTKLLFDYISLNNRLNYQRIGNDGVIKDEYFPFITESFLGKYEKQIWLYSGRYDKMYSALGFSTIIFKPNFHADKIVRGIGPKVKEEGVYGTLIYPDGTTIPRTESFPDIDVLKGFIK